MNIELDEVVGLDVSDDVLERAAGGTQGRRMDQPQPRTSMWECPR